MASTATIDQDTNTHEECHGTGFILCGHEGTGRDEDGWCDRCSEPADEIKVWTWCDCQD